MNYLDECAGFQNDGFTNEAAEQGTFLHSLMEQMLKAVATGKVKTTLQQIDSWATSTHELADDEITYLRFCCERCDVFLAKKPDKVLRELRVVVKQDDRSEFNHGHLDVLYIFGKVGIVQDFKFGWEPVRSAATNLQGWNYALGCFHQFPDLAQIGVEFIQPKLATISGQQFLRTEASAMFTRLKEVVDRAKSLPTLKDPQQYMKPGSYCGYCARAATCAVLHNHRALAVSKYKALPLPPSFHGLELHKPADLALARYWVGIIETGFEGVKKRAFEVAEANGGELRCTLPNGEEVHYVVQERGADRSLGSAIEVAEALKEVLTLEEVLGAADLAITRLEPIVKQAMVDLAKAEGAKLTKKAAWEQASATLEAMGLLTRPDNKIRFLKLQKQGQAQLEEAEKDSSQSVTV